MARAKIDAHLAIAICNRLVHAAGQKRPIVAQPLDQWRLPSAIDAYQTWPKALLVSQ
jgi:hypothetical protein